MNLNGVTGWRLPDPVDVNGDGCSNASICQGMDCGYNITVHSEMSHMFFVTLGNLADSDPSGNPNQPGRGLTNSGLFSNLQSFHYWSAVVSGPSFPDGWFFDFNLGGQGYRTTSNADHAWAVHPGDAGASIVPLPAAFRLFDSGLPGLIGIGRRMNVNGANPYG